MKKFWWLFQGRRVGHENVGLPRVEYLPPVTPIYPWWSEMCLLVHYTRFSSIEASCSTTAEPVWCLELSPIDGRGVRMWRRTLGPVRGGSTSGFTSHGHVYTVRPQPLVPEKRHPARTFRHTFTSSGNYLKPLALVYISNNEVVQGDVPGRYKF